MQFRIKQDFGEFERARERWEMEQFPEGEIQEMVQIYTGYGISERDADIVARTLSKYPEFWIDHMLLHEIGIIPTNLRADLDVQAQRTLLAILAFTSAFILPSILLFFDWRIKFVWAFSFIQVCALLKLKTSTCQWLSSTSTVAVSSLVALCSGIIYILASMGC